MHLGSLSLMEAQQEDEALANIVFHNEIGLGEDAFTPKPVGPLDGSGAVGEPEDDAQPLPQAATSSTTATTSRAARTDAASATAAGPLPPLALTQPKEDARGAFAVVVNSSFNFIDPRRVS